MDLSLKEECSFMKTILILTLSKMPVAQCKLTWNDIKICVYFFIEQYNRDYLMTNDVQRCLFCKQVSVY